MAAKNAFDIDEVIDRIREAVKPFPKAAMFELADEGYRSLFEQVLACIISIRTLDEVTVPTAKRLFGRGRKPDEIAALTPEQIDDLIHASSFHENKARQIHKIALRVLEEYGGELPCEAEVLLSLPGVGLKCANLVLGIACNQPRVSVDVHVHRITNRWGFVQTSTPERTSQVLEEILPYKYWVEINELLVPFGKHICTGRLPQCSTCPVLSYCRQVGVHRHR